jgi:DNA-damage-inducible protein J
MPSEGVSMVKTEMIRVRMKPELKQEAERIFATLALSPTEAIALFYKQVALHRGLHFMVKIPNEETLEAIRQLDACEGLTEYSSVDELMAEFEDAQTAC